MNFFNWPFYEVEIGLRPHKRWEAILPASIEVLAGMLKAQDYHKKLKIRMLQENPETGAEEFENFLQEKAENILEELTQGSELGSSKIPADLRFKRTKPGNLYIGAGNIKAAIEEAAFRLTGQAGLKRRLKSRLYIQPGKVVLYRYYGRFEWIPITAADGRCERHIPPEPPDPRRNFRGKPATISFAEIVNYPAYLQFKLFAAPDIETDNLKNYLEVASEIGLHGGQGQRRGQFSVFKFKPL